MQKITCSLFFYIIVCTSLLSQKNNGIESNMGNLYKPSDAKARPMSPENFNGAKGSGGAITGLGLIRRLADDFLTPNS